MSEPNPIEVLRVKPEELLFDPNSFRLVRNRLGPVVPDESIPDEGLQGDTFTLLLHSNLDTLTESIRRHGWLETQPMIARRLGNGRLVVIDGNRRLASLRVASSRELKSLIDEIAVVIEPEPDSQRCSIEQAVRHGVPTSAWLGLSQILWAEDHRNRFGTLPALPNRPDDSGLWELNFKSLTVVRRIAQRQPFLTGPRVFEEIGNRIFASRKLDWLQDPDGAFVERLLDGFVDWLVGYDHPLDAMQSLPHRIMQIPRVARLMREPEIRRLIESGSELRQILPAEESLEVESGTTMPWDYVTDQPVAFEALSIRGFRGLKDIRLEGLKRVNLIVGVNNAGKTSVLEALYILTRLADPRGLLDTLRVRTRIDPEPMPIWLSRLIHDLPLSLGATVSGLGALDIELGRADAAAGSDIAAFVRGFSLSATLGETKQLSETLLYSSRLRSTRFKFGQPSWLTRSVLHTPYAFTVQEVDAYETRDERLQKVRADWYTASMVEGSRKLILEAIQEGIDPDIVDIRLGGDIRPEYRFYVDHKHRGTMDLSNHGEGLQRIFELGNLFAAHKNGIVLIDEFETAIHTRAIKRFSLLIQQLAEKFQVQVFATTHSKEAVDAFLMNDYRTEDIAAFTLRRDEKNELAVRRFDGPTLRRGVELVDVDIRRL